MKSNQAIKRLKSRKTVKTPQAAASEASGTPQPISLKQAEVVLIDVSLASLYNHGDKRDLDFVNDILKPNNINIPEGAPLESFWDIIISTGLVYPVIGFGKNGRLALTNEGYQIMTKYGSYHDYLSAQHPETTVVADAAKPEEKKPEAPKEPMDGYQ